MTHSDVRIWSIRDQGFPTLEYVLLCCMLGILAFTTLWLKTGKLKEILNSAKTPTE